MGAVVRFQEHHERLVAKREAEIMVKRGNYLGDRIPELILKLNAILPEFADPASFSSDQRHAAFHAAVAAGQITTGEAAEFAAALLRAQELYPNPERDDLTRPKLLARVAAAHGEGVELAVVIEGVKLGVVIPDPDAKTSRLTYEQEVVFEEIGRGRTLAEITELLRVVVPAITLPEVEATLLQLRDAGLVRLEVPGA